MYTWNSGGLWLVRIGAPGFRIRLPLPLYVLTDLLRSWEGLCALILPRLGLPNYAALLGELVAGLSALKPGEALADIQAEGVTVSLRRAYRPERISGGGEEKP